jgi:peptidoglycan pentaglycine glycine transferase (the first glycine)
VKNANQVLVERHESDPDWDNFVSGLESSHYEQSICWARAKKHQGWEAVRIKVLDGSEWLAGAQMLYKKLPVGGFVGRISSGPFFKLPNDQSLDILIRSINEVAHDLRIQYVAITPYIENEVLDKVLDRHGYRPTNENLPPIETTRATLLLDLFKTENELLMDMHPENRRKIRGALKSDLSFREGGRADLDVLFRLMAMVAKKRNEKPIPESVEFFYNIWDQFYPKGYVRLFLVELQGKPITAEIIFTFGDTVRLWKYGWSGEEEKKNPVRLLHWELIRWSKKNGFRFIDIVQVDPYVVDYLSHGFPITKELQSRPLYGPTIFKLCFGGKVLKFSGPWFRFQNPAVRFFYRSFGPALTRMPLSKKLMSTIA